MKECPECRFDIPTSARVCGHCGARQAYVANDSSWAGRVAGMRQGALWGAGTGAVLALIAGIDVLGTAIVIGFLGVVMGLVKGREYRVEPDD